MTAAPGYSWNQLRRAVGAMAKQRDEYAGMPLPVTEARLVLAPRYPHQQLNGLQLTDEGLAPPKDVDTGGATFINSWRRNWTEVILWREADGRTHWGRVPRGPGAQFARRVMTLGICQTFDIEAELRAQATLATLIRPHLFDAYRMTGMFLETSRRSGVVYVFRRLAPTIAMRDGADGHMRILAALCMHPIGHYEDSPFGVMVPTDDVIAHLLHMRGDEPYFWRKANQHAPGSLESMM